MRKPLILLTSDSNRKADYTRRIEHPTTYSCAIAAAGGIPVVATEHCARELAEICDGLLLTGGPDLESELFGEVTEFESVKTDPPRSVYEIEIFKAFVELGKPIFGICRGIQAINVHSGGTLYQDLPRQLGYVHSSEDITHTVYAEQGSLIERLMGTEFKTNSFHHQAIKDLAPGFKVSARSIEGLIEAIEHENKNIFGVQFHPERLTGAANDGRTPDFAPLFKFFINLAVVN